MIGMKNKLNIIEIGLDVNSWNRIAGNEIEMESENDQNEENRE